MIKSVNQVSINILEPAQLNYVYINDVYGIPANTDGWELVTPNVFTTGLTP